MSRIKNFKNLYCIIGASGSGKTSVANLLESKYHRKILKSFTTRPKRQESDTDHIYITEQEYQNLANKVATAEIEGYHYCAIASQIDSSDYYIVDWDGFDALLANYKGRKRGIFVIYLSCNDSICKERMAERGDLPNKIEQRLQTDKSKFNQELLEQHKEYILKTINTGNVTVDVVTGVIETVSCKKDRKTK